MLVFTSSIFRVLVEFGLVKGCGYSPADENEFVSAFAIEMIRAISFVNSIVAMGISITNLVSRNAY